MSRPTRSGSEGSGLLLGCGSRSWRGLCASASIYKGRSAASAPQGLSLAESKGGVGSYKTVSRGRILRMDWR